MAPNAAIRKAKEKLVITLYPISLSQADYFFFYNNKRKLHVQISLPVNIHPWIIVHLMTNSISYRGKPGQ